MFDNLGKDDKGEPLKIAERNAVVTAVDGDRITLNWTQKILVAKDTEDLEQGVWIYDRDLNVVEINGRRFDPASPSRFYPLAPGAEKKDAKTGYPRQDGTGQTTSKVDGKVSNWKSVEVPAGKFEVLTISWDGFYNTQRTAGRSWGGKIKYEIDLSPATWCPVRQVSQVHGGNGRIWTDRTTRLTGFKS